MNNKLRTGGDIVARPNFVGARWLSLGAADSEKLMVLVMAVSVASGPSDGGTPNMRSTSPSSKVLPCRMNLRGGRET